MLFQPEENNFFFSDEYSSLGVIAWGGYGHFGLNYKCNRNGCFETIMNCHWKPEKLPNGGLKRMNLIKSCYQVTSCLNTRASKVRGGIKKANQQHHIYLEVKFRSNHHSSKIEEKKRQWYVFLSATALIEKSNHRCATNLGKVEKCWISSNTSLPPDTYFKTEKIGLCKILNWNGLLDSIGASQHAYGLVQGKGLLL